MQSDKLNTIVGSNINKARLESKLTQEQLAECICVSSSLIRNIESKKVKQGISVQTLYKISIVLDKPMSYFFEERFNEKE